MPTHRSARRSPLPALAAGVSLLVLSALGAATPAYAADGGPAVPETEQRQTLPATGAEIGPWTGVVGALLLAVGAGLLIARRRSTIANGSTP